MSFHLLKVIYSSAVFVLLLLISTSPIEALEVGDDAPEFVLPSLIEEGTEFSLEQKYGQVIYIDFWASWCAPCRLSMPALEKIYNEFSGNGFSVFAINVDSITEDAIEFLESMSISYPTLADPRGLTSESYEVLGMPSGYMVSREGKIAYSHVGYRRGDDEMLRRAILKELSK